MIDDIQRCNAGDLESMIRYLAASPVFSIAALLREGRLTLKRGVIRSVGDLGMLKTEFGNLGKLVPSQRAGEPKFLVSEVLPSLRRNPGADDGLLDAILGFMGSDERGQVEYVVTVFRAGTDLIVKDGNKRTIAYFERRRGNLKAIDYPVFIVEPC